MLNPVLRRKLDTVRSRLRLAAWLDGLSRLALTASTASATAVAFDYWLRFPAAVRFPLALVLYALLLWTLRRYLLNSFRLPLTDEDMALVLERADPGLGDALVTSVQFARRLAVADPGSDFSAELAGRYLESAAGKVAAADPERAVQLGRLNRRVSVAAGAAAAAAAWILFFPASAGTGLKRVFMPWTAARWPTRTKILEAEFLDPDQGHFAGIIAEGDEWSVSVPVAGQLPPSAKALVFYGDSNAAAPPAGTAPSAVLELYPRRSGDGSVEYLPRKSLHPSRNFIFTVEAGDDRLKTFPAVKVALSPRLDWSSVNVAVSLPDYFPIEKMPGEPRVLEGRRCVYSPPAIRGPAGAFCEFSGSANVPLQRFEVRLVGTSSEGLLRTLAVEPNGDDPTRFSFSFRIENELEAVELALLSNGGRFGGLSPKGGPVRIRAEVIEDRPPTVFFSGLRSPMQVSARFSAEDVKVVAEDDYGVKRLEAAWAFKRRMEAGDVIERNGVIPMEIPEPGRRVELPWALRLGNFPLPDDIELTPGDRLEITPVAYDGHQLRSGARSLPSPQAGRGKTILLEIRSDSEILEKLRGKEKSLLEKVIRLIKLQERARRDADDTRADLENGVPFGEGPRETLRSALRWEADVASGARQLAASLERLRLDYERNSVAGPGKAEHIKEMKKLADTLVSGPVPDMQKKLKKAQVSSAAAEQIPSLAGASMHALEVVRILEEMREAMESRGAIGELLAEAQRIRDRQEKLRAEMQKTEPFDAQAATESAYRSQKELTRGGRKFRESLEQSLVESKAGGETAASRALEAGLKRLVFPDENRKEIPPLHSELPGVIDRMDAAAAQIESVIEKHDAKVVASGQLDRAARLMEAAVDGLDRVIEALKKGAAYDPQKAAGEIEEQRRRLRKLRKTQLTLAERIAAARNSREQLMDAVRQARAEAERLRKTRRKLSDKTAVGLEPRPEDAMRGKRFEDELLAVLAKLIERQKSSLSAIAATAGLGAADIVNASASLREMAGEQQRILGELAALGNSERPDTDEFLGRLAAVDEKLAALAARAEAFVTIGAAPSGQLPDMAGRAAKLRTELEAIEHDIKIRGKSSSAPAEWLSLAGETASTAADALGDSRSAMENSDVSATARQLKAAAETLSTGLAGCRAVREAADEDDLRAAAAISARLKMVEEGFDRSLAILGTAVRPPINVDAPGGADPGEHWRPITMEAEAGMGELMLKLDEVQRNLSNGDIPAAKTAAEGADEKLLEIAGGIDSALGAHPLQADPVACGKLAAEAGEIRSAALELVKKLRAFKTEVGEDWREDYAEGLAGLDKAAGSIETAVEQLHEETGRLKANRAAAALPASVRALSKMYEAAEALQPAKNAVAERASPARAIARRERELASSLYGLAERMRGLEAQLPLSPRPSPSLNNAGHAANRAANSLQPPSNQESPSPSPEYEKARAHQHASAEAIKKALERFDSMLEAAKKAKPEDYLARLEKEQVKLRKETRKIESELENLHRRLSRRKLDSAAGRVQAAAKLQSAGRGAIRRREYDPAARRGREAAAEMSAAEKQLAEVQAELEKESRVRQLEKIEDRLRRLLAQQRAVRERAAEAQRVSEGGESRRKLRRRLAEIAGAQGKIKDDALQLAENFRTEGAEVFSFGIQSAVREMETARKMLEKSADPGTDTRRHMQAAADRLEQMLESLRDLRAAKKKKGGGGGGGGGKNGKPMLVPPLAELKLLLTFQRGINKETERFNKAVEAWKKGAGVMRLPEDKRDEARALAERQLEMQRLMKALIDRVTRKKDGK